MVLQKLFTVFQQYKENCLSINGKQSAILEKGIIEFENYFKQIPVPFKIYADFECNLRDVEIYEGFYTRKYHEHIPCIMLIELFVLTINLVSQLLFIGEKMLHMNLLKQSLKNIHIAKK